MARYDLRNYDGVLAFGDVGTDIYLRGEWARAAGTCREPADVSVLLPVPGPRAGDLVWIGNWGDDERAEDLRFYVFGAVLELRLKDRVHAVRFPAHALEE